MTQEQQDVVEQFRHHMDSVANNLGITAEREQHDRPDQSTLITRYPLGDNCWLEVAIRPMIPQVRVGFTTTDRWKNEAAEEAVEETGDTMSEYVGSCMIDAGLDWEEPIVEHYRDPDKFFYFATPLELHSIEDLTNDAIRTKLNQMLRGYQIAFGKVAVAEE